MADRNDDIKQLFSHLGLNPGDYRDLRERTRAFTRTVTAGSQSPAGDNGAPRTQEPAQQAAPTPPPPEVAAPSPGPNPVPVSNPEPIVANHVMAPPQTVAKPAPPTSAMPSQADLSARTRVSGGPVTTRRSPLHSGEATQRWPLIRAAVESPTRSQQRVAPTLPPAAPAAPPPAATKAVGSLLQAVAQQVEAMKGVKAAATQMQRESPAAAPTPVQPPAPEIMAQPPAEAVRAQVPPTVAPPPAPQAAVAKTAAPQTSARTIASPVRPAAPAAAPSEKPSTELQTAFQRLVEPEKVAPQPRSLRLRLNLGDAGAGSKPRKAREEKLEDVFSRISGQPKTR